MLLQELEILGICTLSAGTGYAFGELIPRLFNGKTAAVSMDTRWQCRVRLM